MDQHQYHAYRAYGDPTGTGPITMEFDSVTGEIPHVHAAGVVISFESEEHCDTYIRQKVVTTILPDGRARRWHWVSPITSERARRFFEACESSPSCIHKSHARTGRVRMPA